MTQDQINAVWDKFFDLLGDEGRTELAEALDILEDDLFRSWARQRYQGQVLAAFEEAMETLPHLRG